MARKSETELSVDDRIERFKTRLGIIMFSIFSPVYLAFILICVMNPKFMATDIGSLNVAVLFGFCIIILAIIQGLIYNYICSREEEKEPDTTKSEKEVD